MPKLSPRVLLALAATTLIFPLAARADDAAADTNINSQNQNSNAASDTTLKALLSNRDVPLSIQLKSLDNSWRRFSISGSSVADLQWQLVGAATGTQTGVHFTKGQIVEINGETYLIAYRLPTMLDPRVLTQPYNGVPPATRKPSDYTQLSLSLLNLRTTGSLNDIRAFDATRDMENTAQANAASVKNLAQLGQGVLHFIKARGVLPYLGNPIQPNAGGAFAPFVADPKLFVQPNSGQAYRYNQILGGKNIKHISDTKTFAMFYEAEISGDGTRGVLFLDGHVERLDAARWAQIKKISKITDGVGASPNAGMDEGESETVDGAPVVAAPASY